MSADEPDAKIRECVALLREIAAELRTSRQLAKQAEFLIDRRFRRIEERLGLRREAFEEPQPPRPRARRATRQGQP